MKNVSKQSRKEFLRKIALGSAGWIILGGLKGCESAESEILLGKIDDLINEGSLTGEFNGDLILAVQDEKGGIIVFSLVCSHKRCTVEWKPEYGEFHCPCHEGKYDAQGMVINGPPPGPLRRFGYKIRGEELWVLNSMKLQD